MSNFKDALSFAASLCSASEQCAADIISKTVKFELSDVEKEVLVKTLKQQGFLDEDRFVKAFVNDRFRFSKWGKVKISYMLSHKGIDGSIIDKGLGLIDPDVYESTLYDLLKQKQKSVRSRNTTDLKMKLYRFAIGRGFESSVIGNCIKRMNFGKNDGESTEY
jgi:regulatory protein